MSWMLEFLSLGSIPAGPSNSGLKGPFAGMPTLHLFSAQFVAVWWFISDVGDQDVFGTKVFEVQALWSAKGVRFWAPLMDTPVQGQVLLVLEHQVLFLCSGVL